MYVGWSFNSRTDFFFWETIIRRKVATEWDMWQLCSSVCAKPEVGTSPHSLCGSLSVYIYLQCASHLTMEGKVQQRVCIDLFPSGENWCRNVRNSASSFRRVLPKSIKDIWVVFPFQKWTPILWRRPPPRQAVHLPHRGDRGTRARNHSRWPTSISPRIKWSVHVWTENLAGHTISKKPFFPKYNSVWIFLKKF